MKKNFILSVEKIIWLSVSHNFPLARVGESAGQFPRGVCRHQCRQREHAESSHDLVPSAPGEPPQRLRHRRRWVGGGERRRWRPRRPKQAFPRLPARQSHPPAGSADQASGAEKPEEEGVLGDDERGRGASGECQQPVHGPGRAAIRVDAPVHHVADATTFPLADVRVSTTGRLGDGVCGEDRGGGSPEAGEFAVEDGEGETRPGGAPAEGAGEEGGIGAWTPGQGTLGSLSRINHRVSSFSWLWGEYAHVFLGLSQCRRLIDWLIDQKKKWSIDWLIERMIDWFKGWLVDWLIDFSGFSVQSCCSSFLSLRFFPCVSSLSTWFWYQKIFLSFFPRKTLWPFRKPRGKGPQIDFEILLLF